MTTKPSGDNVDTGDYSATKAPENRPHVESKVGASDPAQTPGGARGAATPIGAVALDPDSVPSAAANTEAPDSTDETS